MRWQHPTSVEGSAGLAFPLGMVRQETVKRNTSGEFLDEEKCYLYNYTESAQCAMEGVIPLPALKKRFSCPFGHAQSRQLA